jgi:hypothetical protein
MGIPNIRASSLLRTNHVVCQVGSRLVAIFEGGSLLAYYLSSYGYLPDGGMLGCLTEAP